MSYKAELLPIVLWLSFFYFEINMYSELSLTVLSLLASFVILYGAKIGERSLYVLGIFLGLVVEVGLGQFARMQHWENASLFGVPVWLPIIWGIGFIAIRRVGNLVVLIVEGR